MDKNWIWRDEDGYTVEIYSKGGADWIMVYPKPGARPISGGSCFGNEITAVDMKPALEALRKMGKDPKNYRMVSGVLIRLAAVPFVESVIAELRAEREAKKASLKATIPGLDQLRKAADDEDRYAEKWNQMMDDESNDGVRPPKPVAVRYADLAAKFPVAAAYLKAETWESAENYAKAGAGKRAKARIVAGESHLAVMEEMETEWSKAAMRLVD